MSELNDMAKRVLDKQDSSHVRWLLVFWMFIISAIAGHFGWSAPFQAAAALCAVGSLAWVVVDPYRTIAAIQNGVRE